MPDKPFTEKEWLKDGDIPVPARHVLKLEVAFEADAFDRQEQEWLNGLAGQILQHCLPGFLEALARLNPNARVSTRFTSSFEDVAKDSTQEAKRLQVALVTQPMA